MYSVCAAIVVVLLAITVWWFTSTAPAVLTPADVDQAVQRGLEHAEQEERKAPADASVAYESISPSLVTVSTRRAGSGPGVAAGATEVGLGSGVIINADGAVLTALHVVDGAEQIQVEFADGTITETASAGAYGNRTIETLEDGTQIWYCHQSAFSAEAGDRVTAGEVIGAVGSTGNTTGPHLHFEVRPADRSGTTDDATAAAQEPGGGSADSLSGDPVDPFGALTGHGLRP